MKVGKILIVMILAALGFQVNAQRATFVHESYNSVRQYIHPLRLSQNQVADWSRLNTATGIALRDIENSRGTARSKARKAEGILERRDRKLSNILSRGQFSKYLNIRGSRGNSQNSRYNNNRSSSYCPSSYSNQDRQRYDDRNGYRNDDRNRDAKYNDSGSYYDGGTYYRS